MREKPVLWAFFRVFMVPVNRVNTFPRRVLASPSTISEHRHLVNGARGDSNARPLYRVKVALHNQPKRQRPVADRVAHPHAAGRGDGHRRLALERVRRYQNCKMPSPAVRCRLRGSGARGASRWAASTGGMAGGAIVEGARRRLGRRVARGLTLARLQRGRG
jgi:hypothetical protein